MDDHFGRMDPEKRRRGSMAVLRALYPELFGEEPVLGDIAPAAEDSAAPTPDEATEPQPECPGQQPRESPKL